MQFFGVVEFPFVCLGEVDVDVEATALTVCDGFNELRIGFALRLCRQVDEGFTVCSFLAVVVLSVVAGDYGGLPCLLRQRIQSLVAF